MAFQAVFFCALAVFVQLTLAGPYQSKSSCSCDSNNISYKPTYISNGISSSSGSCVSIEVPSNGGALEITSIGPIVPSGIAVATELGLAGDLELSGVLPYLTAVEFEGKFDTSGAAPVAYSCGDCVAITEQIGGNVGVGGSIGSSKYGISSQGGCGCKY